MIEKEEEEGEEEQQEEEKEEKQEKEEEENVHGRGWKVSEGIGKGRKRRPGGGCGGDARGKRSREVNGNLLTDANDVTGGGRKCFPEVL